MSSHNVPRSTPSGRSSHRFRARTSHDYDAYANGLTGATEAAQQASEDGVVTPGGIPPSTVDGGSFVPQIVVPGSLQNEPGLAPGVFIDSTGMLIRNGKLTLQDEFGATTLVASGFFGSWNDFVALGVLNGNFSAGSVGSLVGGRDASLPYWYVSHGTSMLWTRDATGFVQVAYNGGTTSVEPYLRSDKFPVIGGASYAAVVVLSATRVGGSPYVEVRGSFYDSSGTVIGGGLGDQLFGTVTFSVTTAAAAYEIASIVAPANAAFMTLKFTVWSLGTSGNHIEFYSVGIRKLSSVLPLITVYDNNTYSSWTPDITGDGTATYSTNTGKYFRIGKMIFWTIQIDVSTVGSGGGNIEISMPTTPLAGQASACMVTGTTGTFVGGSVGGYLNGTGGALVPRDASSTILTRAHYTTSTVIRANGWYIEA